MQSRLKVVYKETTTILTDSFTEDISREPDSVGYAELKLRVQLLGITNPFILSQSGKLISDHRPLRAALECNIKSVPCIFSEDTDELKRFQISMGHKDELMDKYKVLMQDIKKKDTVYALIIRKEILDEVYNIKQGDRSDLKPEIAAAVRERNSIVSRTYRTIINRIIDELQKIYADDKDARNEWIKNQRNGISLKKMLKAARTHAAKSIDAKGNKVVTTPTTETTTTKIIELPVDSPTGDNLSTEITRKVKSKKIPLIPISDIGSNTLHDAVNLTVFNSPINDEQSLIDAHIKTYDPDKINILNVSCLELSLLPDGINLVITSPPYLLFRQPQEGVDNNEEFGLEPDVETYAERLADYFLNLKSKLAPNATIYVILADKMIRGCFQLAPEMFVLKMIKKGFVCKDKIWWVKKNVQFGDGENTAQNVEYILKFCVKGADSYSNYDWLLNEPKFEGNVFGDDPLTMKMSSFVNLKDGYLTTGTANTAKLRELCIKEGFFLEHSSTYLPEVPYACLKISALKNSIVYDPFSGCNNTAVACLWAPELNLTYYGTELNEQSVKASFINIEQVHGYKPKKEFKQAA